MTNKGLGFFQVALLFVGAIMGAGFASGREIWQFFAVFGEHGIWGVVFVTVLFIAFGSMTAYIARKLNTNDMGRVIVPGGSKLLERLISTFMAFILFTVLINMTAAGGAMVKQIFGFNPIIGGVLIAILVTLTVLGEFQRISKVFRYIMPILFASVIILSIIVISENIGTSPIQESLRPSPIANNWTLAAFLYISYNILAMVPIVATSSINAINTKHAVFGSAVGGFFLGILAFVIVCVMQKDMGFSQAMDMPMLAYAQRVSKTVGYLYGIILFLAIYAAATSNFYGFTTKIKQGRNKNKIVIGAVIVAFMFGLLGFKNIVAYMFPVEGYFGFTIMAMLIINFAKVFFCNMKDKGKVKNISNLPASVIRVTGGYGGDSYLIVGSEKTALYDLGMACFYEETIDNIQKELNKAKKSLDYILLSHTHYDHIGALPYILKRWPDAKVVANSKAAQVFKKDGALQTMVRLGNRAKIQYKKQDVEIITGGMRVDIEVKEGDSINLGDESISIYDALGHTDCSLAFMLFPEKVFFASETTGVLLPNGIISTAPLKSIEQCIESAKKFKDLKCNYIIIPHYGLYPSNDIATYMERYIQESEKEKEIIEDCFYQGKTKEDALEYHKERYWSKQRGEHQPKEAYELNTTIVINNIWDSLNKIKIDR